MKQKKQDFTLGLVVIGLVALFLASFFFLVKSPIWGPPMRDIEVHFTLEEGLAALKKGSVVKLYDAYPVGTVTSVTDKIDGDGTAPIIVVHAQIKEEIPLFQNCRIATNAPVIGDEGYLVIIDPGDKVEGEVTGVIRGERPQSLAAAISDLSESVLAPGGLLSKIDRMIDPDIEGSMAAKIMVSLDDINSMTGEMRHQMTPTEQQTLMNKLHMVFDNVNVITASIRQETNADFNDGSIVKIHEMLDHLNQSLLEVRELVTETRPQIRSTVEHVEHATRVLDQDVITTFENEFDRNNPESLMSKLHISMDHAVKSLDNVETMTDSGKRMVVVNRPSIDRAVSNIKEASDRLKTAIVEISLQPWRIMSPPTQDEKNKISFFEAARLFANATRNLDDVSARLEAMAETLPAGQRTVEDEAEIEALRTSLKAAFEKFAEAEKYLYEQVK